MGKIRSHAEDGWGRDAKLQCAENLAEMDRNDDTKKFASGSNLEMDKSSKMKQVSSHPVDRGWAWVILVCVFVVQVNCIGFLRTFGVVFVPLQEKFDAHASEVSLIPGIQAGIFSLAGMFTMTVLIERMSVRNVVRVGGLLGAAGISLCFFADSIAFFYITQSVLCGVGLAMSFGPGFVLLGSYFDKRRALAVTIANVGGSIGTLLMPLVTRSLLEEYSLTGTYLVLGGIFVQNIVMAGFYTHPSDYKLRKDKNNEDLRLSVKKEEENGDIYLTEVALLDTEHLDKSELPHEETNSYYLNHNSEILKTKLTITENGSLPENSHFTEQNGKADSFDLDEIRPRTYSESHKSQLIRFLGNDLAISGKPKRPDFHRMYSEGAASVLLRDRSGEGEGVSVKRLSHVSTNLSKVSLTYLSSETVFFPPEKATETSDAQDNQESDDDDDEEEKEAEESPAKRKLHKKLCKKLTTCFDVSLFKSSLFWLLLGIMFCGAIGMTMPNVFLPPLAIEKGLTMSEAALLLTVIGGLDIVSRLVSGFAAQMKWLKPQTMVCIASSIMGTAFQFTAFLNTPAAVMGLAVVIGLCAGVFVSMMQLITIDFVGLARFPKAFGMVQMAIGIAISSGHPFFGYLRDVTGSYVIPFHAIGTIVFMSVVLLLLEPCVRRLDRKKVAKQPSV